MSLSQPRAAAAVASAGARSASSACASEYEAAGVNRSISFVASCCPRYAISVKLISRIRPSGTRLPDERGSEDPSGTARPPSGCCSTGFCGDCDFMAAAGSWVKNATTKTRGHGEEWFSSCLVFVVAFRLVSHDISRGTRPSTGSGQAACGELAEPRALRVLGELLACSAVYLGPSVADSAPRVGCDSFVGAACPLSRGVGIAPHSDDSIGQPCHVPARRQQTGLPVVDHDRHVADGGGGDRQP